MAKKTTSKTSKKEADAHMTTTQQAAVGIGLTAAAVAAASAYFLYGSENAAKNRKTVKSWMLKAKAEVLEQLEDATKMSRDEFQAVVATAATTYAKTKKASKKDIASFASEMMEHWDALEGTVVKKKAKKVAKTVTKKVKKTVSKKAAPKKAAAKKTTKKTAAKKTSKKVAKK